jgi:hypothetical protein
VARSERPDVGQLNENRLSQITAKTVLLQRPKFRCGILKYSERNGILSSSETVKEDGPVDLDSIIAELKSEQERISRAISALLQDAGISVVRRGRKPGRPKKAGGMSPEGRHRIALAMKRRWASVRAKAAAPKAAPKTAAAPKKRGITAAGRKRLSEAMKRRWAERRAKAS